MSPCPAPPPLPVSEVPPAVSLLPPWAPPAAYCPSKELVPPSVAATPEVAAEPACPTVIFIVAPGVTE